MHFIYIDESGDPGNNPYSKHFILSGLVVSIDDWDDCLRKLKILRKTIKKTYGLNQRTEIHSAELIRIGKIEDYKKIRKSIRLEILKYYCQQIPTIFNKSKVINVCLDKTQFGEKSVFEIAWSRLIQRFDNHLKKDCKSKGIIADDTQSRVLMQLLRKMKVYNPIPSRYNDNHQSYYNAPTDSIIEDIFSRDSTHSYFIQSVDVIAHLLYRKEYPKGSLKKYQIEKQFDYLEPILLKKANKNDPQGIVRN